MPIDVLMPALSPTMEKGTLAKWLKKEGDKIKSGDVIAEIETDKATMVVEAVDEGILARILIADGTEDVAVNTRIAVIKVEGEDASAASAAPGVSAPGKAVEGGKDTLLSPLRALPFFAPKKLTDTYLQDPVVKGYQHPNKRSRLEAVESFDEVTA